MSRAKSAAIFFSQHSGTEPQPRANAGDATQLQISNALCSGGRRGYFGNECLL
jgi:hypothetical protein